MFATETRSVLAGAYKADHVAAALTHTVEVGDGEPLRVLCGRVKLDNLADRYATDASATPTCRRCAARRKDPAAVSLGRRGGKVGGKSTSAAKVAAARKNGKRGGRPPKQ